MLLHFLPWHSPNIQKLINYKCRSKLNLLFSAAFSSLILFTQTRQLQVSLLYRLSCMWQSAWCASVLSCACLLWFFCKLAKTFLQLALSVGLRAHYRMQDNTGSNHYVNNGIVATVHCGCKHAQLSSQSQLKLCQPQKVSSKNRQWNAIYHNKSCMAFSLHLLYQVCVGGCGNYILLLYSAINCTHNINMSCTSYGLI